MEEDSSIVFLFLLLISILEIGFYFLIYNLV
jgi:hypothetical protein